MRNYEEIAKPLALPIGKKTYVIPPVGARLGMKMVLAGLGDATATDALKDHVGERAFSDLLGSAYDELVADDVPLAAVNRVFLTAMADFQFGREAAEATWETGQIPELQAALEAAAKQKIEPNTAEVTKTPSRGSSSGTTSRRATKSAPRRKAIPSRGN